MVMKSAAPGFDHKQGVDAVLNVIEPKWMLRCLAGRVIRFL